MIRNVAGQKTGAQLINSTTGAAYSGVVTVYVTGDNGTQTIGVVGSGLCTAEGVGYYTYAPSKAETNFRSIAFTFTGAGAMPETVTEDTTPWVQNQSGQTVNAGMVDSTTGGAFSGTVTVYITGNAGTQTIGSVGAGICTSKGNGLYTYQPAATETNYNLVAFTFIGTNAITKTIQYEPLTAAQAAAFNGVSVSGSTTARSLITGALQLIGVLADGETPSASMLSDGFRRLNMMMGSWSLQPRTFLIMSREVFDMTAGKGAPDNPYTIGPGGDLDTDRPVGLYAATTLLTASSPNVETPLIVYNDAMYAGIAVKALSNGMASGVWYKPTSPLGELYVYQVPDIATNQLVLYLQKPLVSFATVGTGYDLPDGAPEAIEYNLALRLCPIYSVQVPPDVQIMARSSLSILKRSSYQLVDLPTPFSRRGRYDINAGE